MSNVSALLLTFNANYINNSNGAASGKLQTERDLELLEPKWQVMLIILYSLTATLSLVGNVIAIWVLTAGKRSSRELRIFLVNLSLSDITMAIFSIPFTYTDFMLGRWIFYPSFCPVVQFMQLASVFVSVYTLTAIGIDRYIAIIYPLASSRLTKSFGTVIVLIIWFLAIGLGSISFFNSMAEPFEWANSTYYDCKETWTLETARAFTLGIFIITFALPILILTFAYGSVGLKMLRHTTPGNADLVRDEAQHSAKLKVIKMLSTIVFLFAVCWLPIHVLNLFIYYARDWMVGLYDTETGYNVYIALTIGAHWFSMANSFVNPIIYCFMSENFRTDLKILVSRCCPLMKGRARRGATLRSSDSLHSYRTSVFAMSTKNTSSGNSLITMNSIRTHPRAGDNNCGHKLNGNSKTRDSYIQ
ncbi:substance-P receptor-like isoform X2 [Oppia nitens]|uniref:substance-P receptor-like isoform X2 n=1 Tax=Oppia nitens TaxID=1686743 RepID=UPI0023D9E02D|nr:substance-P receptor-like isoform X2 [Oppia nitens]